LPTQDDLVTFPFGLEPNAARRLIKSGELRARKIGRRWYTKRSDLLALIDNGPRVTAPAKAAGNGYREDLAAIAERVRKGGAK
jgi:hypothetical protein